MVTEDIGQTLLLSFNNGLAAIVNFVPKFIAGLIILLIGIIIASLIKQLVIQILRVIKAEQFFQKYSVPSGKDQLSWSNILAEIIRWFIIILFLIPTADIWGLPQIVTILNAFLLYLPNVFVAAIIGLVGLVFARLTYDVLLASLRGVSARTARGLASVARWAVTIFVFLAILNQLGVASDLVKILFTGFVAMIAIAGGIAFGLGGKDSAKAILEELRRRIK